MGIKNDTVLKQLQSQLEKLKGESEALKIESSNLQREWSQKIKSIDDLKEKIKNFTQNNEEITVTEHAIIRYLERFEKWEIENIKKVIINDVIKRQVNILGNGTYHNKDIDLKLVIKNRAVVTII